MTGSRDQLNAVLAGGTAIESTAASRARMDGTRGDEARNADAREPSVPGTQARVPDFFIAGHQKCGTTALYEMLRSHPAIFMPQLKEPAFFATDHRSDRARRASSAPTRRPRTLDAYLALFAPADPGQRIGEASGQYLRSRTAASGIAALRPDARIIVILREPASFLRSFHLQMVSSRVETETDFEKALALEPERRAGKRIPRSCQHREHLLYSDHVRYVEQLRRFDQLFPPEQMLVLIYDDFRSDNVTTVRRVLRFLDVDDTRPVEVVQTKPVNAVRSMTFHHLLGMGRRARLQPDAATRLERTINALTPMFLKNEVFRKRWHRMIYERPLAPDEQLMRQLRSRFKPEVRALSDYLDRDLVALWGYNDVA
jgi:Sulfotransferase family